MLDTPGILPHLVCTVLYAAVAYRLYQTLNREASAREMNLLRWVVLLPLAVHTWLLYRTIFIGGNMYLGVGSSISAIIWLTVLIYWLGSFYYHLETLQVFILAASALLVLFPIALPAVRPLPHTGLTAFRLHLLISLVAFSLFTIASLQALMMAVLERRLHTASLPKYLRSLPPLLTMEKLLFQIISAGFILLTLTVGSGMVFSEELFGRPLQFTHKIVFGILAWIIFALLLIGRQVYGWRGRLALRWTLAGFLALVLAYIGSKFVLEFVLKR
ncbi:MAG TPA: cytochrome c biogenesis protein CcsA [Burkholderiales bacterium]|nr:cytochrome c biogenesis protein CcsA [Burkholderiales bacterium]